MSLLSTVDDKRTFAVPAGQELILVMPDIPQDARILRTLDDLSEAINVIDPETF